MVGPNVQVKGRRTLNPEEIALMDRITTHGEQTERLMNDVADYLGRQQTAAEAQVSPIEKTRISRAQPLRWVSIARTHFQEGLAALRRAAEQPTNF